MKIWQQCWTKARWERFGVDVSSPRNGQHSFLAQCHVNDSFIPTYLAQDRSAMVMASRRTLNHLLHADLSLELSAVAGRIESEDGIS